MNAVKDQNITQLQRILKETTTGIDTISENNEWVIFLIFYIFSKIIAITERSSMDLGFF